MALGNLFRGDDGVGPRVAQLLTQRNTNCRIVTGCDDSLAIISAWEGARHVLVIDAAESGATPGTVHCLEVGTQPLPKNLARCSSHGVGLAEAMELARILNRMPSKLLIYAIEAASFEPGSSLTPDVALACEQVANNIDAHIKAYA